MGSLSLMVRRSCLVGLALVPGTACTSGRLADLDAGDASALRQDAAVVDACVPTCEMNACNVANGCGGMCACDNGTPCIAGTCGGCLGSVRSGCLPGFPQDGSTPGTCCGVGYACVYYGDGPGCCAVTGQGGCRFDGDCCDFLKGIRCSADDAGETDSGFLPVGRCE